MNRQRCKKPLIELSLKAVALFVIIAGLNIFAHPGVASGSFGARPLTNAVFRYAIIYNDRDMDGSSRDLTVLMDPSEFSEANLRTLFVLLSDRYKGAPSFNAYVETSLRDIDTPEQREGPSYSEFKGPDNPKGGKAPYAIIRHSAASDVLYVFQPPRGSGNSRKIDLRVAPAN